jgi:16S rRNA (uracil1498-N3)-methyltransferase
LSENKITRLKKIIQEAVEQSWRSRIPELIIEEDINIEYFRDRENIFFHTQDNNSSLLKNIKLDYDKWVNLFVWPEWGFSEEEIEIFEKLDFKKVFLWKRILRTETVWVVAGFYIVQGKK